MLEVILYVLVGLVVLYAIVRLGLAWLFRQERYKG